MDLANWEAKSMPWREVSAVDQRREFVRLAMQEGANRRELCRRFGVHPEKAYKWRARWGEGEMSLPERSRPAPTTPQRKTPPSAQRGFWVPGANPAWGAGQSKNGLERY